MLVNWKANEISSKLCHETDPQLVTPTASVPGTV